MNKKYSKKSMYRVACLCCLSRRILLQFCLNIKMYRKKIPLSNQAFNKGLVLPQQDAVTSILKTDIQRNCRFFRRSLQCVSPFLNFAFLDEANPSVVPFSRSRSVVKTYLPTKFISVQVVLVHSREITIFPADVRKL